jgi:hypothetical protein
MLAPPSFIEIAIFTFADSSESARSTPKLLDEKEGRKVGRKEGREGRAMKRQAGR